MPAWGTLAKAGAAARLVEQTLRRPDVLLALAWLESHADRCETETATIAAIPAPTFDEAQRAAHVEARLRAAGALGVERFGRNNVLGRLGPESGSGVALLAHLDTVFPAGVNHAVTREPGKLCGPGVGDNAAGVAGIITALAALRAGNVELNAPLWFVADTAEEGLGDLRGARETIERLSGRLDAVIAVEGTMLGRLGHIAVGSNRIRVRFRASGGHSWLDFGSPSAVHAAVDTAARIAALPLPESPRTTLNIGRIEGGEGVNVIATSAEFLLDMRSIDRAALERLHGQVDEVLGRVRRAGKVAIEVEYVGERPAAAIPRSHPLVEICAAVIEQIGLHPEPTAGSTDANIPLSLGIPALALGVTRGGGIHSQSEWIETAPMLQGVRQLVLICAALCG